MKIIKQLPGYRSGKKWKYILASLFYFFYFITGLAKNDPTPIDLIINLLQRFIPIIVIWIVVFNVANLKSKLPLFKKGNPLISTIGVIILLFVTPLSIVILDDFKSPEYLEKIRANTSVSNPIEESIDSPNTSNGDKDEAMTDNKDIDNANSKSDEEARNKAEIEGIARREALEKAKRLKDARENPALLSEEEYKNLCSDIPWADVVSDTNASEGIFLKKNLMVRQIAKDSITNELVYICGEEKAKNVYTGGTFNLYDRRIDKTHEIKLYDKIYVYGVIDKVYKSWSAPQPDLYIGYLEYLGKFTEN